MTFENRFILIEDLSVPEGKVLILLRNFILVLLTLTFILKPQRRIHPRILSGAARRIKQRLPDHSNHHLRSRILQFCPLRDR